MCSESEITHPMETKVLTRALIQRRYYETSVDPLEACKALSSVVVLWHAYER